MTSIIPALPPRPTKVNVSSTITMSDGGGELVIQEGKVFYATNITLLSYSCTNYGTLWLNGNLNWGTTSQFTLVNGGAYNHGLMVVEAYGYNESVLAVGFGGLENTGQIFAISGNGSAAVVQGTNVPVYNSGLMAAHALTGEAQTIQLWNGGEVINEAGGQILAEGMEAIAVHFRNGGFPESYPEGDPIHVNNAGLIEAHSLDPSVASLGLWMAHTDSYVVRIVNSGTIRADVAIYGDSLSAATTAEMAVEIVTNEATGLIDGDIILDRGDDVLVNDGQIIGDVLMGEGDDEVDTSGGSIDGIVDLSFGDDTFYGSAGQDLVGADRGNDHLEGGGGADLLAAGGDDDVVIGGAGNDSMFGEYGDDRLVTQGGDIADGGFGDDRIELGDYTFELVDGGEGFDTLVLASGARKLNLATVVSQASVFGIEAIELGGSKEVAVRASDIPALTDGSELRFDTTSTDKVHLVGGWAETTSVNIDGVSYRKFTLDGQTVLVAGSGVVNITASAPFGALGLDPIAGGTPAPLPGEDTGMVLTPNDRYLVGYALTQSMTINPEETWWNDGLGPVLFVENTGLELTNYGEVLSISYWNFPLARGIEGFNLEHLINWGTIATSWQWDGAYTPDTEDTAGFSQAVISANMVTNHGLIYSETLHGTATAVWNSGLINYGHVEAYSEHGYAIGSDEAGIENYGTIFAESELEAIGVRFRTNTGSNDGYIEAVSHGAESIGVLMDWDYAASFTNNGEIVADIALQFRVSPWSGDDPLTAVNNGDMFGRVELGAAADSFTNNGLVTGDIRLGEGADTFNGAAGVQQGVIYGEAGVDTITGGAGAEVISGGGGADRLDGGGGADVFLYLAANESTSSSMDRIRNFQGSVDRINLRALGEVTVSWIQKTDSSDGSLYNQVSILTSEGTMTIRVDGSLSQFNFITFAPVYGTAGANVLNGTEYFDEIHGEGGADQISGLADDDQLFGDGGADILDGGAGDDSLFGGDDADILMGGAGDNSLDGGAGLDVVDYRTSSIALVVNLTAGGAQDNGQGGHDSLSSIEGVYGTAYADQLVGDPGANDLRGDGGNDWISGGGGADTLLGEDGDDIIELGGVLPGAGAGLHLGGGAGYDRLAVAGATLNLSAAVLEGDIEYLSFSGALTIAADGLSGFTRIDATSITVAEAGSADLSGAQIAASAITLTVGGVTLNVAGQAGVLTVNGSGGADTVIGGKSVYGGGGNDQLTGDELDNLLRGGEGADVLDGGAGVDTADYSDKFGAIVANLAAQTVTVGGLAEDTIANIEGIIGGGANDTLIGSTAANSLSGGGGDDLLKGGAGKDTLDGGGGEDTADYSDKTASVTVVLNGGSNAAVTIGNVVEDTLRNVENVTGGAIRDVITGDGLANELRGGGGADTLVGGGGNDLLDGGAVNDVLKGGLGDDTYVIDHAGDLATEGLSQGTDVVLSSITWVLGANFENLTLTGTAINGTGNSGNNTIIGNYRANVLIGGNGDDVLQGGDGADRMDGGAGADIMEGGLGNDTYIVSNTLDTLVELSGEGTDIIESRVAWTLADNFENLTLTGTSHVAGTGNSVANTILGNDGNNLLSGLGGNDRLEGNAGADTLVGGDGADILDGGSGLDVFTGGAGVDRFLFDEPDMAGLTAATADRITDFSGDRIALTDLDANTATADVDDAFTFIGTGAFTGTAGQLRYEQVAGNTLITGDTNGDGVADFMIRLDGLHTLSAGHFFL